MKHSTSPMLICCVLHSTKSCLEVTEQVRPSRCKTDLFCSLQCPNPIVKFSSDSSKALESDGWIAPHNFEELSKKDMFPCKMVTYSLREVLRITSFFLHTPKQELKNIYKKTTNISEETFWMRPFEGHYYPFQPFQVWERLRSWKQKNRMNL